MNLDVGVERCLERGACKMDGGTLAIDGGVGHFREPKADGGGGLAAFAAGILEYPHGKVGDEPAIYQSAADTINFEGHGAEKEWDGDRCADCAGDRDVRGFLTAEDDRRLAVDIAGDDAQRRHFGWIDICEQQTFLRGGNTDESAAEPVIDGNLERRRIEKTKF